MMGLFIALRVVANPLSNVWQKHLAGHGISPLAVIGISYGVLALLCAPWLLRPSSPVPGVFWLYMGLCAFLAVLGNVLIVEALRRADLSVLGPINAYKSLVSLAIAVFWLHEIPSLLGLCGVGLILAGSYGLVDRRPGDASRARRFLTDRGIQCRLAALVVSATEAVVLKKAVLVSSPTWTFLNWSVLSFLMALVAWRVLDRQRAKVILQVQAHWPECLSLGISTGLMQWCTLQTFGQMQVGYALALFQCSTILSVILGHRLFAEPHLTRRLAGASIMVAGSLLILR